MRERLTYANVMSTIAVFVAVGLGGAYAADKITSKDLAKCAVKSKAIKDKTIIGKDVKDGKLTGADLADGSLSGADLADGSVAADDLAPASVFKPSLLSGGQGDCIWLDISASQPGLSPVTVRKDGFGQVSFSGAASAVDGPGGDMDCSGSGPDSFSDAEVFVLPPELRPANTEVFINPAADAGIIVAGVNGGVLGGTALPPGTVATAVSGPSFLNVVSFLAADAPNSPAPESAPARIKLSQLKQPN